VPDFVEVIDAATLKAAPETYFVGFFGNEESAAAFKALSPSIRAPSVLVSTNKALANSLGITAFPAYQLHANKESHSYTGALETKAINDWIKVNSLPLVIDYELNMSQLANLDERLPMIVFTFNSTSATRPQDLIVPLAKQFRGRLQFVQVNNSVASAHDFLKEIGVDAAQRAEVSIVPSKGYFVFPGKDDLPVVSLNAVTEFIKKFLDGKLVLPLKSASVPEKQGPVVELVGTTYVEHTVGVTGGNKMCWLCTTCPGASFAKS